MPDADLARRNGVELVRTGSWTLLSGSWEPTRADIVAAVEAQQCPAIKNPKIKLGHIDPRFDGQPAMGWFENLRTADGGHTLLADQVTLPWLNNVQAAAYPDRSVEGNYRHKCGLGHTHPFVITAVALLGVTPPGVSTLKSLQDLPDVLGVAASEEVPDGAQHVQVTIRAAADVHTGAMVALIPTAEDAARLAVDGGEAPEQLHLTLAYLGEVANLGARGQQDVIDQVSTVANGLPTLEAEIFSVNAFNPAGGERDTCLVWGVSGDIIDAVHDLVDDTLHLIDAPIPSQRRPFAAHITAVYTDDLSRIAELATRVGPIRFDRLRLAFGGEFIDIPLMEWPGEEPDEASDVAAAAGNANALHDYWTKDPKGLAKWRDKPHPWTALYRHLSKFLTPDRAKRTASQWYHDVFGRWPAEGKQKGVKAGAGNGATPMPSRAELVRAAWNTSGAPVQKWVQEARPDAAVVVDDTDPGNRTFELYPVTFDGDQVTFGEPQPYDPAADKALVFASAAESRAVETAAGPRSDTEPADTQKPPLEAASSILPAAEPEPEITDPKEDLVSTDLSADRSRLGLPDDADVDATLAAYRDALTKAEASPQSTLDMVAASAAAETEKDELRKEVQVLASQVTSMSTKLAEAEAAKAATVKASVFESAIKDGKIKPADRDTWEKDYDEAPGAVTRVLASIAVGTAVPVHASGSIGDPEPSGTDDEFEAMIARLDSPTGKAA